MKDHPLRQKLFGSALKHHIPDLERLAKKIFSQKAKLEDCYKLYLFVTKALPAIHTALKYAEFSQILKDKFTDPLGKVIEEFDRYTELVETVIDLEAAECNDYIIKADFDSALREIQNKKIHYHLKIKKCYEIMVDDLNLLKSTGQSLEYERKVGWFLYVKKPLDKLDETQYHYVDESKKRGKTKIRNQLLKKLSDTFQKAIEEYDQRSEKIVIEVLVVMSIGSFYPCLFLL